MSGKRDGVQAKMRRQQPGCMYLWRIISPQTRASGIRRSEYDDYLREFEDIINNIFLMSYLSPKHRQEFKVFGKQLDETTKEFGGLKCIRWLASRFRAISMLANNYKVLCFHLQNVSNYGDTVNAGKAEGLVQKIQTQKFVA